MIRFYNSLLPKKFIFFFSVLATALAIPSYAQIGFNNPNPDSSALIDMKANDKGLLIPRMTTTDRDLMTAGGKKVAHALLVYDTDKGMFFSYDTISNPDRWVALNPFNSNGDANSDINASTTGTVRATKFEGFGTIPVGGIIMWSGDPNTLPAGWALCDGSTVMGVVTPDLRERFIVGASKTPLGNPVNNNTTVVGNPYAVNQTGGANQVTLTVNEMPNHNHGGRTGGPKVAGTNTNLSFEHTHTYTDTYPSTTEEVADRNVDAVWDNVNTSADRATTGVNQVAGKNTLAEMDAHEHIINPQGGGQPFDNRSPFYALAFIIRVQ